MSPIRRAYRETIVAERQSFVGVLTGQTHIAQAEAPFRGSLEKRLQNVPHRILRLEPAERDISTYPAILGGR